MTEFLDPVLGVEPRTFCWASSCSTAELHWAKKIGAGNWFRTSDLESYQQVLAFHFSCSTSELCPPRLLWLLNHFTIFNIWHYCQSTQILLFNDIYTNSQNCTALYLHVPVGYSKKFLRIVREQRSLQEIRPISTPWLHALLHFHLAPINLIISQGT